MVRHSAPLVALLLVAGCYESNPRPLEEAGGWLPALLCDRWERCEESSPWGAEGCETWIRLHLENVTSPRYEEAIARGTARPSADARALCEAYAASDCGWVTQAAYEDPLGGLAGLGVGGWTSCPHLIEGLVPVGAECAMDEECAGDATCELVSCDDGCRGVCRAAGPEGAPCYFGLGSLALDECQPGLECASDGTTESRCRRMPAIGEACADGFSPTCARGGRCVGGTCVAVDPREPASGETCDMATPPCAGALVCDEVCVVAPGEGDACLDAWVCGDGLVCDEGTCRREPSEGEPCGPPITLRGPSCPGSLRCSAGTCIAGRTNGEACTEPGECISYRCENGACAAPPYRSPG